MAKQEKMAKLEKKTKSAAAKNQATNHSTGPHADHTEDLVRLKRIRGQIEGIERMIEEGRYCMDIVNQIRSVMAALRSAEGLVMGRHVRHCVKDAIEARDQRMTESKINELLELFSKR